MGCGIGNSAEEILARPAFTVGTSKTTVELFAVSAAELGFQTATAPPADIYTQKYLWRRASCSCAPMAQNWRRRARAVDREAASTITLVAVL
ncbi:MAG: hypothetical protein DI543_26475 [Bradyrhizobium icense]|nr:MAG: hypothetical protein DI543_26475 [Bradyrhizobium icense]